MNFSKELQTYVKRINSVLRYFIKLQSFQDTSLIQVMEYGTLLGGKRLRPFLVYATGKMFNVDEDILDVPAAAIEFIHTYSLIHDDLPAMDNNNLRRGKPACHIKYGEAKAILAGDALQTLAFFILSSTTIKNITNYDHLAMVSELAMASGIIGMCRGQALDIEAKKRQITLKDLEQIYHCKTGKLIRAAVRLGALSAGNQGRQVLPILDRYAESIGLAFQIQDDILDVISNTTILGKNSGVDQQLKKSTYPTLLGLEKSRCKALDLIKDARQALNQLYKKSLNTSVLEELANYIIQRDK